MRCELYCGPPMNDIVAHLNSSEICNALGDNFDTMRTAFQYRRGGVVGRIGEYEEAITVPPDGVEGACGSVSRCLARTYPGVRAYLTTVQRASPPQD
jgi:hypothetical protein